MADANPLDPNNILARMADALPTHQKDDTTSDLSSSYEVITLAVHAIFSSLNFRLLGFDEDHRIEEQCKSLAPRLPQEWNRSFGAHALVYAHKQSAMTFVVKIDRMGSKVEVRGLAVGADNIHRLEYPVRDLVSSSALPLRIPLDANGEDTPSSRADLPAKLAAIFPAGALARMVSDVQTQIIQKLIPKLQVEGYVETPATEDDRDAARQAQDEARRAAGHPLVPPGGPAFPNPAGQGFFPPRPAAGGPPLPAGDFPPPGFEDEHEILAPPRGGGPFAPGRSPFNIGHDDLNPPGLGPHDPLRGSFVGGGLPRPGGGSGMHPTFDDPLFGGAGVGQFPGQGGGEFNPQAPPGARWDPVGPGGPGGPGFPGRGGPRGGPFGGSGGFGGFGGDII